MPELLLHPPHPPHPARPARRAFPAVATPAGARQARAMPGGPGACPPRAVPRALRWLGGALLVLGGALLVPGLWLWWHTGALLGAGTGALAIATGLAFLHGRRSGPLWWGAIVVLALAWAAGLAGAPRHTAPPGIAPPPINATPPAGPAPGEAPLPPPVIAPDVMASVAHRARRLSAA